MDIAELIKLAYSGPNALVFSMLNVCAFAAHRVASVSQTWTTAAVAIIGGGMGALGGFIGAQAEAGVAPTALLNAALVAGIVGAGSSLLIGVGVSVALDKMGAWPVSDAKRVAERIRDPLDPTAPPKV